MGNNRVTTEPREKGKRQEQAEKCDREKQASRRIGHIPTPILASNYEVEINGYAIPKTAQIFVNVWAIGRDSTIWPNPASFEPERFLNRKIDYKGRDFTLLPFGSGRRTCPGLAFADRILPLMVATFIHDQFDWKLEAGVKPEDVDTTEKLGNAVHKAVPLIAIPIKV
ncbi:hypothetical protein ACS0TY_014753 [Phlomoides rotata]